MITLSVISAFTHDEMLTHNDCIGFTYLLDGEQFRILNVLLQEISRKIGYLSGNGHFYGIGFEAVDFIETFDGTINKSKYVWCTREELITTINQIPHYDLNATNSGNLTVEINNGELNIIRSKKSATIYEGTREIENNICYKCIIY